MAHFALTDATGRRYLSFQRLSLAAMGWAGAQAEPFKVWLGDWRLEASQGGGFPWRLQARQGGIVLSLELDPLKPAVLNGEQGLSRKSPKPGNASYYYSITRMAAQGTLELSGQELPVRGLAWLDREWSTSMLAEYQIGWDWFALHLDDGSDLMYLRLRYKDGTDDPANSSGTWVDPCGVSSCLTCDDIAVEALDFWESPTGGRYPARWRLKAGQRVLEIRPLLADQEFRHYARYWEGAVDVLDARTGAPAGRGYVELTGYAPGRAARSAG